MNDLRVLLYETPEDPYMNLAFEEAFVRIALASDELATLRLWRNKNAIVIGYFQKAVEEINLDEARKHDASITRRFTGGGAVYHDLGNLNYAISVKASAESGKSLDYVFKFLINGVLESIKLLGLNARLENINDVVVGNYKVSGTAASIKWGVYFLHGSILVDTNLEILYRVLKVPKIKLLDKGISDVKYRVKNIRDILGRNIPYREIVSSFTRGYSKILNAKYYFDMPSKYEIETAKALYDLKYTREDWNMGLIRNRDLENVEEYIQELIRNINT